MKEYNTVKGKLNEDVKKIKIRSRRIFAKNQMKKVLFFKNEKREDFAEEKNFCRTHTFL